MGSERGAWKRNTKSESADVPRRLKLAPCWPRSSSCTASTGASAVCLERWVLRRAASSTVNWLRCCCRAGAWSSGSWRRTGKPWRRSLDCATALQFSRSRRDSIPTIQITALSRRPLGGPHRTSSAAGRPAAAAGPSRGQPIMRLITSTGEMIAPVPAGRDQRGSKGLPQHLARQGSHLDATGGAARGVADWGD